MPGRKVIDTIDKKEELLSTMDDSHKNVSEVRPHLLINVSHYLLLWL